MRKPKFFVIGATKAGTSSLRHYLRQHPDIFIPDAYKEPGFFCHGVNGDSMHRIVRDEAKYYGLFDGVTTEATWGEITPHYLTFPQAAANIHTAVPDARLVVSLRNPVDRAFSLYQMNLRNKGHNETVPFVEAVRVDPVTRRTYSEGIIRFQELFGTEQLLTLLFDDLVTDPTGTTQTVFSFLGVDADFVPETEKVVNPGGLPRSRLLHLALSNRTARRIGRRFVPMAVQNRLEAVKNANLVAQRLTPDERVQATEEFRDDILRTQDLIGRDLSRWLAAAS